MPDMNGFQTVRHIMGFYPVPIVIISSASAKKDDMMFQALDCGALDFIPKPLLEDFDTNKNFAKDLVRKIKIYAAANVSRRIKIKFETAKILNVSGLGKNKKKVVAIVSSTGGPGALKEILPLFPQDLPVGIVIIQHIVEGFIDGLVGWLQKLNKVKVRVAKEGDVISPGVVLFSPDMSHIIINESGKIKFEKSPPVGGVRPAADILFPSIAKYYGSSAIGVIMTGMGDDGARGIERIKKEGGNTIAQNKETCAVFGMPKAAIERGTIDKIVPLQSIPETIIKLL